MMQPPYYQFVQPLPVVCLVVGYKPPSRRARRRSIYGKQGQKKIRERGLWAK